MACRYEKYSGVISASIAAIIGWIRCSPSAAEHSAGRVCWQDDPVHPLTESNNLAARNPTHENHSTVNSSTGVAALEAALDPLAAAKLAKLRHVSDEMPGITRHKARSGFDYRLPDGELVRDIETLKRIRSLAIPPAWTAVWICPYQNGHIQATGRDNRGRKQYRYHPVGAKSATSRNTARC
jgi:Bacterial DNA topoisomerase IB, N-terminal domain